MKNAKITLAILGLALLVTSYVHAQTFTVLYQFKRKPDAMFPHSGLTRDAAGNLYGTTYAGGLQGDCVSPGCGTVYKVTSDGKERVLYRFKNMADGAYPYSNLALDSAGNLYGTTSEGGLTSCFGGCGTVFKLDRSGNKTTLYQFTGDQAVCFPYGGLTRDQAGNLYGTTGLCGFSGLGSIWKLDVAGNFTVVHLFNGSPDGAWPYGAILDKGGNLYGTAQGGGTGFQLGTGYGTIWKIDTQGNYSVLHAFNAGPDDGLYPDGTPVMDKAGNLYGTTDEGGTSNGGTVWKLAPDGTETILHNFTPYSATDGTYPESGLILDFSGTLYGTTTQGGDLSCAGGSGCGTVYQISTNGDNFTLVHSFSGGSDGQGPSGWVIKSGSTLYGTALQGGSGLTGTVWKITLPH